MTWNWDDSDPLWFEIVGIPVTDWIRADTVEAFAALLTQRDAAPKPLIEAEDYWGVLHEFVPPDPPTDFEKVIAFHNRQILLSSFGYPT